MACLGPGSTNHSLFNEISKDVGASIGTFPRIIRPAFTLGGSGGGIASNPEECDAICKSGLDASPVSQILIEKSLKGWKEVEYEVVRDAAGRSTLPSCVALREGRPAVADDGLVVVAAARRRLTSSSTSWSANVNRRRRRRCATCA